MVETKDFKTLLQELGEGSSLHGLPKIITSRQIVVKVLWSILLLGTMTLFALQLRDLIEEFYSYPTKTSVHFEFEPLEFPAMTFCNMNPARLSQLPNFKEINDVFLNREMLIAENWTEDEFHNSAVIDEHLFNDYNTTKDTLQMWENRFILELGKLTGENRSLIGHQREEFIHSAMFSGLQLPNTVFREIHSHVYGNCFTLDDKPFISYGTGHKNSLKIIFNIETHEYIKSLTSAYGVRMVFHEKGSYPFPDEEGLSLSSHSETHIGLRMSTISRLGGPYGDCLEEDKFDKLYNIKYTVPLCRFVCLNEVSESMCSCKQLSQIDFLFEDNGLRLCSSDDDFKCLREVIDEIHSGEIECKCSPKCEEKFFSRTTSRLQWPHDEYLKQVILDDLCKRNRTDSIDKICNFTDTDEVSSNFLAVVIYFEDLDYEVITEEPLYNTVRFLSDIGGAMGLYIGASVLTYVEILQLALEMFLLCKRKWTKVSDDKRIPEVNKTDRKTGSSID